MTQLGLIECLRQTTGELTPRLRNPNVVEQLIKWITSSSKRKRSLNNFQRVVHWFPDRVF